MILIAYGAAAAEEPFHTPMMRCILGAEKSAFHRGYVQTDRQSNPTNSTKAQCVHQAQ